MAQVIGFDESKKKQSTCRNCSAIVEYTLSEVQNFTSYDYGGGSDIVHYINCPNCGKQIQGVKAY